MWHLKSSLCQNILLPCQHHRLSMLLSYLMQLFSRCNCNFNPSLPFFPFPAWSSFDWGTRETNFSSHSLSSYPSQPIQLESIKLVKIFNSLGLCLAHPLHYFPNCVPISSSWNELTSFWHLTGIPISPFPTTAIHSPHPPAFSSESGFLPVGQRLDQNIPHLNQQHPCKG